MAVDLGAVSADHLEYVPDEDIRALCGSFGGLSADTTAIKQRQPHGTIPVLLPGCSFFLGSAPAPARRMIEAGLPVALATDMNPGSCPVESLPLVMSMAATILRMTPMESLVACTANAAAALGRADRIGAIAVGHQADLVVLDIPNLALWPYRVGVNPVRRILKAGRAVSLNGE